MPSETTRTVSEDGAFTNVTIYSYSECLTYDDSTGYTLCNGCGQEVANEWDCADEEEMKRHKEGECIKERDIKQAVLAIHWAFGGLFKVCEYCHHTPCDCPF